MKKVIIILSFVLLVLILLPLLINYFAKKKAYTSTEIFPAPTFISKQSFSNITPRPKQDLPESKTLSPEINSKIQRLKNQLPIANENFEIDYSYPLEKFIIVKKSPLAEEKLKELFINNQISYEEFLNENLIIFTEKPLKEFKDQLEDSYIKVREEKNILLSPTPLSEELNLSPSPSKTSKDFNPMIEFLNIFLNFSNQSPNLPTSTPTLSEISPTIAQNQVPISSSNIPSNLNDIFNEVGQKVGVPPKILEVVMKIEMPSTFDLSSEQIANYSAPNRTWPSCGPNVCSAAGPMQMTIGVDANGNKLCPRCGVGFCPNAWSSYGRAVNSFGGYNHQANPCNIRDNIYGSAAKLKNDSGASGSSNWTREQVYQAAARYYGSCSDKHRYSRLQNRTYCEYVWDYYKNN
mgnify:FL=1